MTMEWGIVARSRSTGIQIRKKLSVNYTDPQLAQAAADLWQGELNAESRFGVADWAAWCDAAEGGPSEENVEPAMVQHPAHADPATQSTSASSTLGMNGRL